MSRHFRAITAFYLHQWRKCGHLLKSARLQLAGAHRGQSFVEMIFTVLGVSVVIITAIEGSIVLNRGMEVKQLAYLGSALRGRESRIQQLDHSRLRVKGRAVGSDARHYSGLDVAEYDSAGDGHCGFCLSKLHRPNDGRTVCNQIPCNYQRDKHRHESVAMRAKPEEDFHYELDKASRHDGNDSSVG